MGLTKILKFILLLPFKIIFFPFKLLRNIFSSRQQIQYREMKGNLNNKIDLMKEKVKDERLSEKDRKKIELNIKKAEKNRFNLTRWRKNSRRLENDPDNMYAFNKSKRYEKKLRKFNSNFK